MKITDLQPRTIAIYAGRFHPFHIGHAAVFRELAGKFGLNNTFITTSGKIDPISSPFSFDEKALMMQAAGIPAEHISQETNPYSPAGLTSNLQLDPSRDIMVFGIGSKDMAQDPRFKFTVLKDGTPSYFQKYTGKNMQPYSADKNPDGTRAGHAYIYPVADVQFSIAGQPVNSASQIRALYRAADDAGRMDILNELYPNGGSMLKKIKRIFNAKLSA